MKKKAAIEMSTETIIMILIGVVVIVIYMFTLLSPTKIKEMIAGTFEAIEKTVFG